jgi:hypothetical protein
MRDNTFTPGPWVASENAYGKVFINGGKSLTTSVGTEYRELIAGGNSHDTLTITNARLIAAAPDMYNALWEAVELSDRTLPPSGRTAECQRVYDLCRAALAKSEGDE